MIILTRSMERILIPMRLTGDKLKPVLWKGKQNHKTINQHQNISQKLNELLKIIFMRGLIKFWNQSTKFIVCGFF